MGFCEGPRVLTSAQARWYTARALSEKIGVLFLQSQARFGADSAIHAHLMRHLDRERFEVHVACTTGEGVNEPQSLEILREIPRLRLRLTHFAPGSPGRDLGRVLMALRGARRAPADFAHLYRYVKTNRIQVIHSGDHVREALYGVALARLAGAKSVVHVHVKWSEHYSALAKWAVRNADAVFAISRFVEGSVKSLGRKRPVYTVLNAIDVARWEPQADGGAVRRELGIAPDAPLIASVSRLFSWKGQRELVKALAIARLSVPGLKLLIVGGDEPQLHGGSFTEELKQLAASLGVSDDIVFTGARSDIPQIMAACDVFTLPSFEEPFGLVFLEAMAMKRPVVAVANGGTPEVVEHGLAGLLSPPWDVPALAQNIVALMTDPERRRQLGEHGRKRVVDYFNAQRMANDAASAYLQILNGPS